MKIVFVRFLVIVMLAGALLTPLKGVSFACSPDDADVSLQLAAVELPQPRRSRLPNTATCWRHRQYPALSPSPLMPSTMRLSGRADLVLRHNWQAG
jgi:hypothetical protein